MLSSDTDINFKVLLGMMEFGLDPQEALNLPRFYINVANR
jgi:Gamma-glutamyltransferase